VLDLVKEPLDQIAGAVEVAAIIGTAASWCGNGLMTAHSWSVSSERTIRDSSFGSLNHAQGDSINLQNPDAANAATIA